MKKLLFISSLVIVSVLVAGFYLWTKSYGAPPYDDSQSTDQTFDMLIDPYANWTRPEGPIRIGLQAGHWKTSEMPEEQERIKENGGGTSGLGVAEWEVNLKVAELTAETLRAQGYVVDILPATVPEDYWADAFISIHADGNLNPTVNGYKVAANARDRTGDAASLSAIVEKNYGQIVGLRLDPNITVNMTRYYAFNARRYVHAVHPMTPAILVELGFMTNPTEARMLINNPQLPAKALAVGVTEFISSLGLDK